MKKIRKYVVYVLLISMLTAVGCGSSNAVITPDVTPTEAASNQPGTSDNTGKTEDVTPTAEPTKAPEVTIAPEATKAPEATTAPEATKAPEVTEAPEATKVPEATATPTPTPVIDDNAIVELFFQLYDTEPAPTDEDLQTLVKERGWDSYKIDEQGIHLYMTKVQRDDYIAEYREELKSELENIVNETGFEDIESIEVSDDFQKFVIVSLTDSVDMAAIEILLSAAAMASVDSSMSGESISGEADIIYKATGELVYSISFTGRTYTDIVNELATLFSESLIDNTTTPEEVIFADPDIHVVRYKKNGETILQDDSNAVITLSSITSDSFGETFLGLNIENMRDENLSYMVDYVAVNDVVASGYLFTSTLAKHQDTFTELELYDLGGYTPDKMSKLQLAIRGYNPDTYETAFVQKVEIHFDIDEISYDHAPEGGDEIILDNKYVRIIAGTPQYDELFYSIPVYIYNKTGIDLDVSEDNTVVDGFMCGSGFFETVPAGIWVIDELTWDRTVFNDRGIMYPSSIVMDITTDIDGTIETISADKISFNTAGLGKLYDGGYTIPSDATVLYDGSDFTIAVLETVDTDSYFGFEAKFFIENKTDKDVEFLVRSTKVNGIAANAIAMIEIYKGCKTIDYAYWLKESLNDNGITDISNVEVTLYAIDMNNPGAANLIEKTFTFDVK